MSLQGPDRMARVSALLREKISEIFLRDLNDPALPLVTITDVVVAADLRNATVYYSVLGEEARRNYANDYIRANAGAIGRLLGSRIELRYTPRLAFRYDNTPERAGHVFEILERIERERREKQPQADPRDAGPAPAASARPAAPPKRDRGRPRRA